MKELEETLNNREGGQAPPGMWEHLGNPHATSRLELTDTVRTGWR